MILALICIYLACAAIFYLRLTATATDVPAPPRPEKPSGWHRARRLTQSVMRRIRALPPRP